jgi:DNA-binding NtrC family response regulator
MVRILIFHPDSSRAHACREVLSTLHVSLETASSVQQASSHLGRQFSHVVVWFVADFSAATEMLSVKNCRPGSSFVALLDEPDTELTVACMRFGASDVCIARDGLGKLKATVEAALARTVPAPIEPREALEFPCQDFIGRHPRILEVFDIILSVKDSDSTVLITGESGTGKEIVSRAIHELSPRKRAPWVAVNCGAIPGSLLESELFGHMKGAFTGAIQNRVGRFQTAGQGTLFLDEIGDLPPDLQVKILRAIQSRQFEPVGSAQSVTLGARIIAATNKDLEKAVAGGSFREDLYYRLNVIPIHMPPLRARKSDIPLLASAFLKKFNARAGKSIPGISQEAMDCLMQYHWPGNVRELENLMERVTLLKRASTPIEVRDFPPGYFKNVRLDRFVANVALPDDGLDFNEAVSQFENELILQALKKTAGNRNRAASLLHINRTTLVEKLKRKGITIV